MLMVGITSASANIDTPIQHTIPVRNITDVPANTVGNIIDTYDMLNHGSITIQQGFRQVNGDFSIECSDPSRNICYQASDPTNIATINHIGYWTDENGNKHWVNATFATPQNPNVIMYQGGYNVNGHKSVGFSIYNVMLSPGSETLDITMHLTSEDGSSLQGKEFLTGISDLDEKEGVELVSGATAIYKTPDTGGHLKEYGINGYQGLDESENNVELNDHIMQHMLLTTVKPDFTMRYYVGALYDYTTRGIYLHPIQPPQATLTLNAGNGIPTDDDHKQTFVTGNSTTAPNNPYTRKGYSFIGWKTPYGANYKPGDPITISRNMELIAQWQADSAQLNYDANGGAGTMPPTKGHTDEQVTVANNEFTRNGYKFMGWNTKPSGGTSVNVGAKYTLPAGGATLYAQWKANPAQVTYDPNGGSGTIPPTTGNVDETVKITPDKPTRGGYTFTGWKDCNATATYHASQQVTLPDGGLRLCAQWSADKTQLAYDPNGGTGKMTPTVGHTDEQVTVSENGFTRKGYTFTGWATKPADGTTVKPQSKVTLPAGGMTLYAQWQANPSSLTYDPDGGEGDFPPVNGHVDDKITVTSTPPTRKGYSFTGWKDCTTASSTTIYHANSPLTLPDGGIRLCAQWYALPARLVYMHNGGNGMMPATTGHTDSDVRVADSQFTRNGYTFTGWNTKADGTGTPVAVNSTFRLHIGDSIVYAQWKANPAQLILNPNGGVGDTATLNGVTGGQVSTTGHVPTRAGYTLTGWNTSKDGNGVGHAPETEYTLPAGTTTWFAQWTANKAIVSYNANGGAGIMSDVETITDATVTVAKNGFERKGYSFTGWALTPQGTVAYQPQDALKVSRQPLVLYAMWAANPSRITYNLKGGDSVIPNTVGKVDETVHVTDKTPTRKGYSFNGWKDCKANTVYQPNSEITLHDGGVALCAEWSANPSQVTYDPNGGTGVTNPTTGEVDETVKAAGSGFERKGYSFTGWNVKPDGSGDVMQPADSITLPDGGMVLYAMWSANPSQVTYNLKGGDGSIPDTKGHVDETVKVTGKTPSRNGYQFTGWKECKTSTPYKAGSEITLPDGGVELCAQWDKLPEPVEPAEPEQSVLASTGANIALAAITSVLLAGVAGVLLVRTRRTGRHRVR
ncbi:hypothetical protein GCM10007377_15180 [Galliscardovia ingluviei]|uniref:Uncharacterized protein n=2 Tax=Galliscardovia ingluviei TaxID=1769422 RepID=A0A8J3AM80_9BIFI|nr:hypothetical protein GCM10007377_15180 [Galliscardovia ingluviei]